MKTILVCAALALLGCKKGGAGSPSECAGAIGPSVDKMTAAGAKRMAAANVAPELEARMAEAASKLKVAILNRCTTDHWPAEVLACYKKAENREDLSACRAKLPEDQAKALHTDELGVMTSIGVGRGMMGGHGGMGGPGSGGPAGSEVIGTPPPSPPAGGPAAGSASVPAAAGSAK
ncbi:hypothetical protein BH11MYX1_BH11MYX1_53220 [soil metagenome]